MNSSIFDHPALLRGERRAWNDFVRHYGPPVYQTVARVWRTYTGRVPEDEIEDVVQKIFTRLIDRDFKLLQGYDQNRASVSTWLNVIARSTTIDNLRRRRELPAPPTPETEAGIVEAPYENAGPEIPERLLSGRQKLVLTLLFDKEMAVDQAAALLQVTPQTIRSTKHKALTRLRHHFAKKGEVSCPMK